MNLGDLTTLTRVLQVFEALGIPFLIGGSVASSIYGTARPTQDFDLVADLDPSLVPELVARLGPEFYAEEAAIREAIELGTSFNLISLETLDKIDVFATGGQAREQAELHRAVTVELEPGLPPVRVTSPEDIVLRKLEWFRMGGGVSDRQWQDVLGVLKVQGSRFDHQYARRRAAELGLSELLEQALTEAV